MECPYCGSDTRVVDSRPISDGIRRRRECKREKHRFTTHERLAPVELRVVKTDGRQEEFDPAKLERVVRRVAGDDGLSTERVRRIVQRVGLNAEELYGSTVRSYDLALLLIDELRPVHPLAYHRFLSNYTDPSGELLPPPGDEAAARSAEVAVPQLGLFAGDDADEAPEPS